MDTTNVKVKVEATDKSKKKKNCSWCAENQSEINDLLKQIHGLQGRVSKIRQDMDHCVHDNKNQGGTEIASAPTSALVVQEHEVKLETEPDPRPPSDGGGAFTFKCAKEFNCSASFSTIDELKRHLAGVHNYDRYVSICDMCGLVCLGSKLKVKHIRAEHGVACSHCPLKFTSHHAYMNHMKNEHKGVKSNIQHPCSECGQEFAHRGQLIGHIKSQHGVVSPSDNNKRLIWPCGACKWNSTSVEERDEHVRRAHPHVCRSCGATYPQFQSLRQHCIAKHGIDPLAEEQKEDEGAGYGSSSSSSCQGSGLMTQKRKRLE